MLRRRVALVWFLIDALTHLTVELSYVYVTAAHGGAATSRSPLAYMWREYGRADARWAQYDPTVLSLELLTVFVAGPLALACAYGIWYRRPWRHLACVVISVMELCEWGRLAGTLQLSHACAMHRRRLLRMSVAVPSVAAQRASSSRSRSLPHTLRAAPNTHPQTAAL